MPLLGGLGEKLVDAHFLAKCLGRFDVHLEIVVFERAFQDHAVNLASSLFADVLVEHVLLDRFGVPQERRTETRAAAVLVGDDRTLRQQVLGHAEVRAVFKITKVGAVAGCYVTAGTIERNAFIRVTRDDIVIENDRTLDQLKRFKDDAKEVRSGQECGMKIAGYDDIKEGDILECYKQVEVRRKI